MVARPTRRALLGAAGAAALALAGCGDRSPDPPAGGDAGELGRLLVAEQQLAGAWAALGSHRELAGAISARERANVAALRAAGAAGVPGEMVARPADLRALLAAERAAGEACVAALGRLRTAEARGVAFDVSVTHAAHASAVLAALGRPPLPDAFPGTGA